MVGRSRCVPTSEGVLGVLSPISFHSLFAMNTEEYSAPTQPASSTFCTYLQIKRCSTSPDLNSARQQDDQPFPFLPFIVAGRSGWSDSGSALVALCFCTARLSILRSVE